MPELDDFFFQKEDHWQNPENFFFQGKSFLEGKIQKMQKKILKKIYCPKSFIRS